VQPAVDGVISRMHGRVRMLERLDRTITRMQATRPAPGRAEALDARDRNALQEAESDVKSLLQELESCALAIHDLKSMLPRVSSESASEARSAIESEVARLSALTRGGAEEGGRVS
jgi:hypothetical protein